MRYKPKCLEGRMMLSTHHRQAPEVSSEAGPALHRGTKEQVPWRKTPPPCAQLLAPGLGLQVQLTPGVGCFLSTLFLKLMFCIWVKTCSKEHCAGQFCVTLTKVWIIVEDVPSLGKRPLPGWLTGKPVVDILDWQLRRRVQITVVRATPELACPES